MDTAETDENRNGSGLGQRSFDFLQSSSAFGLKQDTLTDVPTQTNRWISPELHEIRLEDDGGATNIQGIEYQLNFTVWKCLDLVSQSDRVEYVSSETHEDVVVKLADGRYEFYQVKTRSERLWTVSALGEAGVWRNFLRSQRAFGVGNMFIFVSNQAAQYGKNPKYDLAQMKDIVSKGRSYSNEKELQIADFLIDRIWKIVGKEDTKREDVEALFWNTRLLTNYEKTAGLRARCLLRIAEILEGRGGNSDRNEQDRIFRELQDRIVGRLTPQPDLTYSECLRYRKLDLPMVESCFSSPQAVIRAGRFSIENEPNRASLIEKTRRAKFPENITQYFVESRNFFASRFVQDVIHAADYLEGLRMRLWGMCVRLQVQSSPDNVLAEYSLILDGLQGLADQESKSNSIVDVNLEYLHGMLCQLTAECHHDWYRLEESGP